MPPKGGFGPNEAKLAAYATPFVLLALLLVLVLVSSKAHPPPLVTLPSLECTFSGGRMWWRTQGPSCTLNRFYPRL